MSIKVAEKQRDEDDGESETAVHGKPPFVFRMHWNHEPDLHKSLNDE